MTITLDGLEFELSDFVGTDGLGHTATQSATTGASGQSYPAEPLFPERIFRAALNQLGQGLFSTSTSSVAIGTGSKAFTLATSVQITDGAFVLITDQANDANYMYGQVTSVVGLVYTVNVTATGGSGTIAAWNFQVSGAQGATGAAGASYTDEQAQDAVGGMLTDTATIDFTYNDGAATITADVKAASITEAMQVLADNTTNNATTSAHGYLKKLSNTATEFMNGVGNWAVPAGTALPRVTGRYYLPASFRDKAETSNASTANRLYFAPIFVSDSITLTKIGVNADTGSGSLRFGIYNNTSGLPSTLVLDCGEDTSGSSAFIEKTISQALTAGWYWVAVVCSATPTLTCSSTFNGLLGVSANAGTATIGGCYMTHAYGALPSSASSLTNMTATVPAITVKI